jgi:superfamily I DNA/RNA helicase
MTAVSLRGVHADDTPSTSRPGLAPTSEQANAITAFRTGDPFVLEAGAGTGKTSTLRLMAGETHGHGLCLMYNRSVADEARRTFPRNTKCATAHSLAYAAVGKHYRDRLNGPRVPAWKAAEIIGAEAVDVSPTSRIGRNAVARLALETVSRFCNSADTEIGPAHVPYIEGVEHEYVQCARDEISRLARTAWTELRGKTDRLRFDHDTYLKLWQLSGPRLSADFIMLDEAQDAYPAILDVVLRQSHAQLVAVGDQSQAIYSYKGSMNAMRDWPAEHRLPLSQSFRFGPEIAAEANVWLGKLGSPLRLRGTDGIASRVVTLDEPAAVLCRTNMQAVEEAMTALEDGARVAIVGGVKQIQAMARAALDLKDGRGTDHPELCAFASWADVQEYVEDDQGAADLRVLVSLVDRFGAGGIFRVTDAVVDEAQAEVVVSTAHKSKGREFESVRVASDFRPGKDASGLEASEVRLMYVAVTRAKRLLDCSALDWARDWSVA